MLGFSPLDEELGLLPGSLTPRLQEALVRLSTHIPSFAKAARELSKAIAAGEGPLGKYVATLNAAERARTDAAVRGAYEAGRPDGPRSFANVAWACRGVVPVRN